MEVDRALLLKHLKKVSLDGEFEEATLGKDCSFAMTDHSKNLVSQGFTREGLENVFSVPAPLGDVGLLLKIVGSFSGEKVLLATGEDGFLIVACKGEGKYRYRLSDADLIPTTVENVEMLDGLEKLVTFAPLSADVCKGVIKSISLLSPEKCVVKMQEGSVVLQVGDNKGHNSTHVISAEPQESLKPTSYNPKKLRALLGSVLSEMDVQIGFGDLLVVKEPGYRHLLSPLDEAGS